MADIQNVFLNKLKKGEESVTVFLVNGVKLNGVLNSFDANVIVLKRDCHNQLVYKHAISTILPAKQIDI